MDLRQYGRAAAYILLAAAIGFALFMTTHSSLERERSAQFGSCKRVQVLRDQANELQFVAYDAYNDAYAREVALIKGDPTNAAQHRKSAQTIKLTRDRMVVTGPTDCNLAVDHPQTYRPPLPEFIRSNSPRVKAARERSKLVIQQAGRQKVLSSG